MRCDGLSVRELPHADAFHSGLEVCLSFVGKITMPTDYEMQFHRTFLDLKIALEIWNEDASRQSARSGPDRQRKCESDPVYAYHVEQGPHYPWSPPGESPDKRYNAIRSRSDGRFEPLVIITKRGLSGQDFPSVATQWERTNSALCGAWKFTPIVNEMMEVTGHYANVRDTQLVRPAGISITSPEECIENGVPLYLWIKEFTQESKEKYGGVVVDNLPAPEGWESFSEYHGGIDVLVLPNGEVIGAKGKRYQSNNGTTYSVMSPLDFWSPGSRLLAAGIRGLTSRLGAAAVRALRVIITTPSKDLALLAAARFSRTLPGVAVSARGMIGVEHLARRTLMFGEDMAKFRGFMAMSQTEPGFYDLFIHGNSTSFRALIKVGGKKVWRDVSVREVADAIRPMLKPGDKIRLLACNVGNTGGPGQQLANELERTVWSSSTKLSAIPESVPGGRFSFVPKKGGKFYEFVPERGAAKLSGGGGKVTANEVQGEINSVHRAHPRPPR